MEKNLKFIFWIVNILYSIFLLSLFYLDYFLFTDFFGFEKGLFFSLFEKVDLVSISSIVLLILLSFIFVGLYVYISIGVYNEYYSNRTIKPSVFYPSITSKKKKNLISEDIKKIKLHIFSKQAIVFWAFLTVPPIIYIAIMQYLFINNVFLLYLLVLIYNFFTLSIVLKFEEEIYKHIFSLNTILLVIGISLIYGFILPSLYLKFFMLFYYSFLVSYMIMFVYSDIKNDVEKISKGAIYISCVFFIFILNLIFTDSNKTSWSEEIVSNKRLSTNLIFNNGNLQTNSLDIKIKIPQKHYPSLIKQLKYYESKDINLLCVDNDLLDEHMYTISKEYYYLEITSNIKMYFKNLVIKDKDKEDRFIGYRIFIIEEKKYANREGSEYILISAKNKIINSKNYQVAIDDLEFLDKNYIKTNNADKTRKIDEKYIKTLKGKKREDIEKVFIKNYIDLEII